MEELLVNDIVELVKLYTPQLIALIGGNYALIAIIRFAIQVIGKKIQTTSLNNVQASVNSLITEQLTANKVFIKETLDTQIIGLKNELETTITKLKNETQAFQNAILNQYGNTEIKVEFEKQLSAKENELQLLASKYNQEIEQAQQQAQSLAFSIQQEAKAVKEQVVKKKISKKKAKKILENKVKEISENAISLE